MAIPLSSWGGQICFSDGHCISDPSITGDPDATPMNASALHPNGGLTTGVQNLIGKPVITPIIPAKDEYDALVGKANMFCGAAFNGANTQTCVDNLTSKCKNASSPSDCMIAEVTRMEATAKPKPKPKEEEAPAETAQQPPAQQPGQGQGGNDQAGNKPAEEKPPGEQRTPAGQEVAPMCSGEKPGEGGQDQCSMQAYQEAAKQCKERHQIAEKTCENAPSGAAITDGMIPGLENSNDTNSAATKTQQVRTDNAVAGCKFAKGCDGDSKACNHVCEKVQKITQACEKKGPNDPEAKKVKTAFMQYKQEFEKHKEYCGKTAPDKVATTHNQVGSDVGAAQQASQTRANSGGSGSGAGPLMGSIGQLLQTMMQKDQQQQQEEQQPQTAEVDLCTKPEYANSEGCKCRGLSAEQCRNISTTASPFSFSAPQPYVNEEDPAAAGASGYRGPASYDY